MRRPPHRAALACFVVSASIAGAAVAQQPPTPEPAPPPEQSYPPQPAQPPQQAYPPATAYPPQPAYPGYPPYAGYAYPPYVPAALPPKKVPYVEGQPGPPGYRLESESDKGLVIGGAITLGVGYTFMLLTAPVVAAVRKADGDDPDDANVMMVPVVGPFLSIWTLDSEGIGTSLLILDGLMQAGGTAMLVGGLASKRKYWLRGDLAGVRYQVSPGLLGRGSPGIGVSGTF